MTIRRPVAICLVLMGLLGSVSAANHRAQSPKKSAKTAAAKPADKPAAEAEDPKPAPENVYGVIEIGAKGIKALVIQKLPEKPDAETPPTKTLKEYDPADRDAGNLESIKSGRVVPAISEIAHRMEVEFQLPRSHFYLVGSSGLQAENRSLLSALTFSEGQLDFINPSQEAILNFKGVVPAHRINDVVVLDIGSGNSKGAYLETPGGKDFETYSIPLGTASWAEAIAASRQGDTTFNAAAEALRTSKLLPTVRGSITLSPGMQGRRRVYLAGGTPWAMTTFQHLSEVGSHSDWVKLQPKDIDDYLRKATENPDALLHPAITDEKSPAALEVKKINSKFTREQILAGAQILKAFADEMGFRHKDALFFSRRALYSWPHGYLLEKLSAPAAN